MEIINHRLIGEGIKHLHTPHVSGNIKKFSLIVYHDDEGASMLGTESWIMNPVSKVSYHVLVGKKGEVTQFVDFNKRAWHAGKSSWKGFNNINDYGIGVSMQNRNEEPYTDLQIQKFIEVCKVIANHYKINEGVGHKQISPGRKTDPHNGFPMSKVNAEVFGNKQSESSTVKKKTTSDLNLRHGPSTDYKVVEVIKKGSEVHVLSEKNGWSSVVVCASGNKGWVSSKYIN